ncbi:hypothetical protein [Candidatus Soleaferrea massiliensis]|uniref:hypothetical protein n=1 Tax=Candidatus Soleaferrea massiliensis TaxID=1470354 RepID=UPI00058EF179|nr:hypothetical protein [Candidatus Soleaferrea massiliensis]
MTIKCLTVRIEESELRKIRFVSDYDGRFLNRQILILIRKNIMVFEAEHDKISEAIFTDMNGKSSAKNKNRTL